MKMYKWFVWSPNMQKYVALPGLFIFPRSEIEKVFGVSALEEPCLFSSFSIPSFN